MLYIILRRLNSIPVHLCIINILINQQLEYESTGMEPISDGGPE